MYKITITVKIIAIYISILMTNLTFLKNISYAYLNINIFTIFNIVYVIRCRLLTRYNLYIKRSILVR